MKRMIAQLLPHTILTRSVSTHDHLTVSMHILISCCYVSVVVDVAEDCHELSVSLRYQHFRSSHRFVPRRWCNYISESPIDTTKWLPPPPPHTHKHFGHHTWIPLSITHSRTRPLIHTLSTHPTNTPYQHTLSTHPNNPPYQRTLITHLINAP